MFLRTAGAASRAIPPLAGAVAHLLALAEQADPAFAGQCAEDRVHLEAIRAARQAHSQDYFARHAAHWDELRSLHIADGPVEAALATMLGGDLGRLLDVGTGTGVLALAAAKHLHHFVSSGDIDPISVEAALGNAALNGARPWLKPVTAVGVRHPALDRPRYYDLIFANILARPLRLLAPSIATVAGNGAELILSGLLAGDVAGVLSAYKAQGFYLKRRIMLEGWATLLLARGGAAQRPI